MVKMGIDLTTIKKERNKTLKTNGMLATSNKTFKSVNLPSHKSVNLGDNNFKAVIYLNGYHLITYLETLKRAGVKDVRLSTTKILPSFEMTSFPVFSLNKPYDYKFSYVFENGGLSNVEKCCHTFVDVDIFHKVLNTRVKQKLLNENVTLFISEKQKEPLMIILNSEYYLIAPLQIERE